MASICNSKTKLLARNRSTKRTGWQRRRTSEKDIGFTGRKLWRIVDGVVLDVIREHPEYFRAPTQPQLRHSINKRMVGAVLSFAVRQGVVAVPPRQRRRTAD